eukprot:985561-Pyramimonas_sp.AAC.1
MDQIRIPQLIWLNVGLGAQRCALVGFLGVRNAARPPMAFAGSSQPWPRGRCNEGLGYYSMIESHRGTQYINLAMKKINEAEAVNGRGCASTASWS